MAYEFRFPDVGEGIVEGEIVQWRVRPGDRVQAHQILVVVETDKAVVEIPSPVKGILTQASGEAGDQIRVGELLAVIAEDESARASQEGSASPVRSPPGEIPIPGGRPRKREWEAVAVRRGSVGVVGELEEASEDGGEEQLVSRSAPANARLSRRRANVLPHDRKRARDLGVEVDAVRGTGPGGRVTEADIRREAARGSPARRVVEAHGVPGRDEHGPVERVPLRGVRRKVAEAMVRSLAVAPQVTTTEQARVGLLWDIREKERPRAEKQGIHLTVLAFVIKAVVSALRRDPWLNAIYDEDREEVVLKGYFHVGVAVETQDGLIVPVVRDADRKTLLEIAREVQELSAGARARTLTLEQLRGGTFTVSNYGAIGGLFATPILNPPQAGLLGIGRVADQPVARDGGLRVEKVLPLSLTFDHRVVDGATAQHFLRALVRDLEDPERFLAEG